MPPEPRRAVPAEGSGDERDRVEQHDPLHPLRVTLGERQRNRPAPILADELESVDLQVVERTARGSR